MFAASALKCWRCTSDTSNGEFCDDPFDESALTEQQRRWTYVECSFPPTLSYPYVNHDGLQYTLACKKVKVLGKFFFLTQKCML